MKENDIKNAGKALTITTVLTLFIATFEMVNALRFYKPGMNLLDIASYVQANRWIFAFTFIFANLVLFPSALLLYKANGISLKKEVYERETLGGDILWGVILAIAASLLSLLYLPIYKGCTELAFVEDDGSRNNYSLCNRTSLCEWNLQGNIFQRLCKKILWASIWRDYGTFTIQYALWVT